MSQNPFIAKVVIGILSGFCLMGGFTQAQVITFYSETFDSDPGWTTSGDWEFGVPQGLGSRPDPTAGFTGTNVYGYNLAGAYSNNLSTTHYLYSDGVDCTDFSNVTLKFYRWLGVESSSFDHANLEVSNDGIVWHSVWEHSGFALDDTSWQLFEYDVSSVAANASNVSFRWGMGTTDGSVTYGGWNLDDLTLSGISTNIAVVNLSYTAIEPEKITNRIIHVTRGGNTGLAFSLDFSTMENTALEGVDFVAKSGVLNFAAGETQKFVSVEVIEDAVVETLESFSVIFTPTVGSSNVYVVSSQVVFFVEDDDLTIMDVSYLQRGNEGLSSRDVVITRSQNVNSTFGFDYFTSNITAIAGLDYSAAIGSIQFNTGETSKVISITIEDDAEIEEDESFGLHFIEHAANTNFIVWLSSTNFTLTITDNDFIIVDFPFYDGFESGQIANYWNTYSSLAEGRIRLSSNDTPYAGSQHLIMDRSSSGASNLNELNLGINLFGQSNVILSFTAKDFNDELFSIPNTFTDHYNGDGVAISTNGFNWYRVEGFSSLSENYQEYSVNLDDVMTSHGIGYSSNVFIRFQQYDNFPIPTDGIAFDEISINQNKPTVSFLSGQLFVEEENANILIPLIREVVVDTSITLDYIVLGGSASNGLDYSIAVTGSVAFAVGQTSNSLSLAILDDLLIEPDEDIIFQLQPNALEYAIGSLSNTVVIIAENDGPGKFSLSTNQYMVGEGDGFAYITVERRAGTVGAVSIQLSSFAGTATPGMDYVEVVTNVLFPDGVASQVVQIVLLEDATTEGTETFEVFLSLPTGGTTLGDPNLSTVVIGDNEVNYFQGFEESISDTWNYTIVAANGSSATRTTSRSQEGSYSLDFNGSNNSNGDPYALFDNVVIAGVVNVRLSVSFAALNVDSSDDLYLDISYDNGGLWESTKLVDGFNNGDVEFGTTNALNPATVSPNPYITNIPDDKTQIQVRLRFDERTSSSAHLDHYYIDNIHLYFESPDQPPTITEVPDLVALVDNPLHYTFYADDIDLDLITLAGSNLPPSAVFNQTTFDPPVATLSYTANVSEIGLVYTAQVYATDIHGTATQEFTIAVVDSEVYFETEQVAVDEGEGTIQVAVVLSRSKNATVSLSFAGSTAQVGSGLDATVVSTTVVFTSGGTTTQFVEFVLNDDLIGESTELIRINLIQPMGTDIRPGTESVITIRDNDSFSIASANLTTFGFVFADQAQRMLQGLKPDIVAAQEFNVANGESYRSFVDRTLGTNYEFYIENTSLPNGVISRWPIVESGWWDDSYKSNREYVWARIDLPGGRDLIVVNVHLDFSGGATVRANEAGEVLHDILQSAYHSGDYIAICGDLNTVSYGEAALVALESLVSDGFQPTDQFGDIDTNASRNKRYDYVLPNARLDAQHIPYALSGVSFVEGMVFDTTLWTPETLPPPVLLTDARAPGLTHQVVIKQFAFDDSVTMDTTLTSGGAVTPGTAEVNSNFDEVFSISADPYYLIDEILLDGTPLVFSGDGSSFDFTWIKPQENATLDIQFREQLALFNVPHQWLAQYGITSNFDAAVQNDLDGDSMLTWQEYFAGTNPDDETKYLYISSTYLNTGGSGGVVLEWPSESGRVYRIERSTNLVDFVVIQNFIPATPSTNQFVITEPNLEAAVYRIGVDISEE